MGENTKTKLGLVPAAKINQFVAKKVWEQYEKDSAALGAALKAVAVSKQAVVAALAAKVPNMPPPALLDFWSGQEGLVLVQRSTPKKAGGRKAGALVDLTAVA